MAPREALENLFLDLMKTVKRMLLVVWRWTCVRHFLSYNSVHRQNALLKGLVNKLSITITQKKNINRVPILHGCAEIWNFSSSVEIFFQQEKRNFIYPSGHVMFYLLYKHQWTTKPFHFNSFWCKRCNFLCSHSNGDIFTCEDIKSLRKSSPSISLVFI